LTMWRLLELSISWKKYVPAGSVVFGNSTAWLNVKKVSWLAGPCAPAFTDIVTIAAVMHARATLRIDFIYPPPRRTHVLRYQAESSTFERARTRPTCVMQAADEISTFGDDLMKARGHCMNDTAARGLCS
jgi:hypothetical protein